MARQVKCLASGKAPKGARRVKRGKKHLCFKGR